MRSTFCGALLVIAAKAIAADLSPAPVTFSRDVLPILQKNCQTCHRPGQAGPMSFLTSLPQAKRYRRHCQMGRRRRSAR
jgi:hypothetical protein